LGKLWGACGVTREVRWPAMAVTSPARCQRTLGDTASARTAAPRRNCPAEEERGQGHEKGGQGQWKEVKVMGERGSRS
jgi:hypothetical protein